MTDFDKILNEYTEDENVLAESAALKSFVQKYILDPVSDIFSGNKPNYNVAPGLIRFSGNNQNMANEYHKKIFLTFRPLKRAIKEAGWTEDDFEVKNNMIYIGNREILSFETHKNKLERPSVRRDNTYEALIRRMLRELKFNEEFLSPDKREKRDSELNILRGSRSEFDYKVDNSRRVISIEGKSNLKNAATLLEIFERNESELQRNLRNMKFKVYLKSEDSIAEFIDMLSE